jgi:hypothetical protein
MVTVLLSIFAHGLSAMPGIALYARKIELLPADAPEHHDARIVRVKGAVCHQILRLKLDQGRAEVIRNSDFTTTIRGQHRLKQ